MLHVVSVGGGLTSTLYLPERVVARYGRENTRLVMARLPNEDPDVWRLCDAVQSALGVQIEYIGLNLTPWDIFRRVRMIGNTRVDPCSRVLKREVLRDYVRDLQACGEEVTMHLGITWDEQHRTHAITRHWSEAGASTAFDLLDGFSLSRHEQMADCEARFGFVPRLYRYGFSHNNCGGACVKAGMQEWARLLYYLPDVYEWWESNELTLTAELGSSHTILRDRTGKRTRPLTLPAFRKRCRRWWSGCLPGLPFELLPRVRELNPTPACRYCAA